MENRTNWTIIATIIIAATMVANSSCKATVKHTSKSPTRAAPSVDFSANNRISDAKNSTTNNGKRTATIAILKGALATEQRMEAHLKQLMDDLIGRFDESTVKQNVKKVEKIQSTIARDKKAILILVNALDLSRKNMTFEEYQRELKRIVHEEQDDGRDESNEFVLDPTSNLKDQIPDLKEEVEHHVQKMKNDLRKTARIVLRQLKNEDKKAKEKVDRIEEMKMSYPILSQDPVQYPQYLYFQPPLPYIEVGNGIDLFTHLRRQGDDSEEKASSKEQKSNEKSSEKQEKDPFESEEFADDPEPAPGGLAGLIAALSGGEEGSDIGALVAALTQALTNIFGPGGLDIEGLLSSGTSLIAGLLAGEENFGKVLGGYIGTALDGFSGGGADNNGEFFGLFLGTLLSQLSADPEDDDLPAKPKIFIEKFFKGFGDAQRKEGGTGEDDEGHKDGGGSAAFFGFITHIVSSIVGGITSFIANASLGSSAGSSAGSAEFSAGSSGSSSGDHPTHKP